MTENMTGFNCCGEIYMYRVSVVDKRSVGSAVVANTALQVIRTSVHSDIPWHLIWGVSLSPITVTCMVGSCLAPGYLTVPRVHQRLNALLTMTVHRTPPPS